MPPVERQLSIWRVAFLGLFFLLGLFVLGHRLWNLQVGDGPEIYQKRQDRQSVRSVRLPGMRGNIVDRHGVRLAENRPSYGLSLYLEELRRPGSISRTLDAVMDTLYRLSECMDLPAKLTPQDVRTHLHRRTPLPLTAWTDLPETAMARFVEHAEEFPGAALTVDPVRTYPQGALASHLLGYVGRADVVQEAAAREAAAEGDPTIPTPEKTHFYLPEMAGKSGVERKFDGILRANEGGKLEIQVDVAGFKFDEVSRRAPGHGSDVELALDVRIQRILENILATPLPEEAGKPLPFRGAGVVVDPRNGDILAMAAMPGFDPNQFVPSIPRRIWDALQQDPARPLYNRATMGEYAPGSTFKPLTLLAALRSGKITPQTRFHCPGYFDLGNTRFRCWSAWGHGSINMQEAIMHSCNVYLFHAALACGPEAVQELASEFGFGRKSGIALNAERPGLVPNAAWKRRVHRDGWRDGDTCNISIGQGALLVTPLQLALYTAALANGGTLYRPRLIRAITAPDGVRREIAAAPAAHSPQLDPAHVRVIRNGMRDVVNAPQGTGRRARLANVLVAAKTGTAEYGRKSEGKKMTWMIAFAPFDNPRYAVAILIEDGQGGGATCGPRIQQLFARIFAEVEGAETEHPRPAMEAGPHLPTPGELPDWGGDPDSTDWQEEEPYG